MSGSDRILARLMALHPKKIDLSLGRMERLLARLGHPERRLPPVFHVAGTNGKGSTVAYLRAVLEAAGYRVHVYTSPHLVAFRERIRLAGTLIPEDALSDLLARVEAVNGDDPITFFEVTTAAAFLAFAEHPADVLLLEVGLGGRLDATNVVADPVAAAVTPISLDHQEFLGADIATIAAEKAGIARAGRPLVSALQDPAAHDAIARVADAVGAVPIVEGRDWEARLTADGFTYADRMGELHLPLPNLHGPHQYRNAALAVACLRHQDRVPVPGEAVARGITQAIWPARLQDITGAPGLRDLRDAEIWLDGGHNPAGAATVAAALAAAPKRTAAVIGLLANKDADGFLAALRPEIAELIAVPIPGETAHDPDHLVARAQAIGLAASVAPSWRHGLDELVLRGYPRVVICGSLYLAGQVLAAVGLLPE